MSDARDHRGHDVAVRPPPPRCAVVVAFVVAASLPPIAAAATDSDGDHLSNRFERDKSLTSPHRKDTDRDGITDDKRISMGMG